MSYLVVGGRAATRRVETRRDHGGPSVGLLGHGGRAATAADSDVGGVA